MEDADASIEAPRAFEHIKRARCRRRGVDGHNAPRGFRWRASDELACGVPFPKRARRGNADALERLDLRIARIDTARLKVEPHFRDQRRGGSQALEQRDFPFPAGAIGDPPRMKPQANPHTRGEASELRARPFEIARIAGSR